MSEELKFDEVKVGDGGSINYWEDGESPQKFTDDDVADFIKLSRDKNPLHTDNEFAKKAGFEGKIVPGMLLLSRFSYLYGLFLYDKNWLILSSEFKFRKPIYVNKQFIIHWKVISKSESTKILEVKNEILNRDGEIAVDGTTKVQWIKI